MLCHLPPNGVTACVHTWCVYMLKMPKPPVADVDEGGHVERDSQDYGAFWFKDGGRGPHPLLSPRTVCCKPLSTPPHGKPGLVEFVWIDDAPPCVDHKPDPRGAFTQRRSVALGKKILPMTVSKA